MMKYEKNPPNVQLGAWQMRVNDQSGPSSDGVFEYLAAIFHCSSSSAFSW
jgi:hypothetical protein